MQWIKKTNSFLSVLLFAFAHFVRAPFDPNMHHDGLIYTAAVAAAKGLIPHRDYFSQYGPLTPIIHGWWLAATDRTLLSLRLFNALLLTLISILLFVILRRHQSFLVAFLLVSIWSFSSPEILPADLPWPSVISTLLLMIAISIIDAKSKDKWAFKNFSWLAS